MRIGLFIPMPRASGIARLELLKRFAKYSPRTSVAGENQFVFVEGMSSKARGR